MRVTSSGCASSLLLWTGLVSAQKPAFINATNPLKPLQTDGRVSWRTWASADSPNYLWNVSTNAPAPPVKTKDGIGMYGYNVYWRGEAFNPSRPLMIFFGSTISRRANITDLACVLSKGIQDEWPYRIRTQGGFAKAILQDAGMAIVSIVSPTCYDVVKGTSYGAKCSVPNNVHMLRHYRPEVVIDILNKVQTQFGFDSNKVVAAGGSMGGRGAVRLGTAYPLRAVSCMGCHLERANETAYQSTPWNKGYCGEGCYDLGVANINSTKRCTKPTPETYPLAYKLASTQVQFYASVDDEIANFSLSVKPSCDAINAAAAAAGTNGSCVLRMISQVSDKVKRPPKHQELAKWSYDAMDLNWIIAAYGGSPVTVLMGGNVTEPSSTATATSTSAITSNEHQRSRELVDDDRCRQLDFDGLQQCQQHQHRQQLRYAVHRRRFERHAAVFSHPESRILLSNLWPTSPRLGST
ncbi:hypothetical protein V8E36_000587 [Tilletia maclaganii]